MASSVPPLLELHGVTKAYSGVAAVADVSLTIQPGELFALLGASGSGKTTLLRLIAGLDRPDAGTIRVAGADMTDAPPYERPVNTVFQSYALFPHMSVRGNIAFGLKQEGLKRSEIEARVAEMLDLVQMTAFRDRRPHQLSGGQKQRVALARSLAKLPKLLLLDEPMAALDRRLREQTRLELAAIQRRVGIGFILVTHDQEEAMSLADRLAVMEAGRIVQIGTPREIYDRPNSRFVAEFVGETNLLEGRIVRRSGSFVTVRVADGEMVVREGGELDDRKPVWIAVRPERLRLCEEFGSADNRIEARVQQAEFLGDSSVIHVLTKGQQRLRITVPHDGAIACPAVGDFVKVAWAPGSGVLLTH